MKVSYLVDTDWVIDHLSGNSQVTDKLKELEPSGIALSIVSLAELYEGVYHSRDPEQSQRVLDTFLEHLPVLPIDEEICKTFGKQRGRLRQEGQVISDFDLLIGSTCLRCNLTLLTNNRDHFQRLEGLNITSIS